MIGNRLLLDNSTILLINHLLLLLADELIDEFADLLAKGSETSLLGQMLGGGAGVLRGVLVVGDGVLRESHCGECSRSGWF